MAETNETKDPHLRPNGMTKKARFKYQDPQRGAFWRPLST